jgi:predicted transcriptional regulator of viral defense system
MNIFTLHKKIGQEEVDYLLLKSLFSESSAPRDKISRLLKSKVLVRVKKGLYVFSPEFSEVPFSKEVLANLIYGPSAISLHYALSFYGMIPERVQIMTSVTNKRNKHFITPVGEFFYHYLAPEKYAIGVARVSIDERRHIFIATPEKALVDTVLFSFPHKNQRSFTNQELEHYLLDDLRIDELSLKTLNRDLLHALMDTYRHPLIRQLGEYLTS